ncbi:MAG TPA: glycosyltransferase [Solirubrobacterales bacterium]|nr:glycosyltransferase [Solirubrobacterales bacterium]
MSGGGDHDHDRAEVGVVIATRDRREVLLSTLTRLRALPESPPIVVVDNASRDGTAAAVAERFPAVELLSLDRNRGAAARNFGAELLATPYVAFSDDDSWWNAGSLRRAAELFDRFPSLGLLAARILVGPERRLDPTSAQMRAAPAPGLPGPRVVGFVACGALVRRSAFLGAGGFCERFGIGGEERLLTIDMGTAGWDLCYAGELVAVHAPDGGARPGRPWRERRNDLWTSWLRMPAGEALTDTWRLAREGFGDRTAWEALLAALPGLPWALRRRRAV